jgi:hypothetical protein
MKQPEQWQRKEKAIWLKCQVIENILSYSWECQYSYARKIIKQYCSIVRPALKVKDTMWNNFASAFINKEIHSHY